MLKAKLRARVGSEGCEAEASTSRREEEESTVSHESVCVASKKKPDMSVHLYESDEGDEISDSSDRYMFIHKVKLLEWARSIARCGCGKKMTVKEENVEGMVSTLAAVCKDCKIENKFCTSEGGRLKGGYDIHKKIVKSSLETGNGYVGVRGLFVAFNMHPLSEKGFYKIAKQIEDNGIKMMEHMMEKTWKIVHDTLKNRDGNEDEVKNLKVSCDGSWSKRGFTSLYGFVSVIESTTGYCVDFVVLSKHCRVCENSDENQPTPEHDCTKNYDGSSPAMETEGWKQLWSRSIEKCKFRYVQVVSDGDSKGFSAVKELDPYGGVAITKLECCNHVSKRLGNALLNASKDLKLGGKGEGTLTKPKVLRLAHYFGKAINRETTVEDMRHAIFGTLRHCMSTDSHPQHSCCPDGEYSWCFYKRAIANDQPIPSYKSKMSTYLSESVVNKIKPTYQRLSTPELLEKCQGDTQNSNESLHSVIWNKLPKTKFFSIRRMRYIIYHSVLQFNHGSLAVHKAPGELSKEARKLIEDADEKRIGDAVRQASKKEEAKQRKIRKVHEEEQRVAEEGETYGAGMAPLP